MGGIPYQVARGCSSQCYGRQAVSQSHLPCADRRARQVQNDLPRPALPSSSIRLPLYRQDISAGERCAEPYRAKPPHQHWRPTQSPQQARWKRTEEPYNLSAGEVPYALREAHWGATPLGKLRGFGQWQRLPHRPYREQAFPPLWSLGNRYRQC